jgi:hypothetical protein
VASATPSAAKRDDSLSANWESFPTSNICDAGWLIEKSRDSFFGFHPSRDIKHDFFELANSIFCGNFFCQNELVWILGFSPTKITFHALHNSLQVHDIMFAARHICQNFGCAI